MNNTQKQKAMYLRNVVFGIEDSFVSTVGLLSGIAASHIDQTTILMAGVILILVESISMGAGSLISEHEVLQYEAKRDLPYTKARSAAFLMFISYLIAGLVPLFPYVFFGKEIALPISIIITLFGLFLLGSVSASKFGGNPLRNGFRTLVIGGVAIIVGITAGKLMVLWNVAPL